MQQINRDRLLRTIEQIPIKQLQTQSREQEEIAGLKQAIHQTQYDHDNQGSHEQPQAADQTQKQIASKPHNLNNVDQSIGENKKTQQNIAYQPFQKQQKYKESIEGKSNKNKDEDYQQQPSNQAKNLFNQIKAQRVKRHVFEQGHQLVYSNQNEFVENQQHQQSQASLEQHTNKSDEKEQTKNGQTSMKKQENRGQNHKQMRQNDGKWQQYLKQAFSHYCKSTYATGRHPTFDKIKSVTRNLNINTFTSLCRDFQINLPRLELIHIFKKSTNFATEMNFNEFLQAIRLISADLYVKNEKLSAKTGTAQIQHSGGAQTLKCQGQSKQEEYLNKLMRLMHMHSAGAFHNKMLQLDIRNRKHGVNAHQNLIKLKTESEYKFKIESLNGKNPEEIKEELQIRRLAKQENKQMLKHLKNRKKELEQAKFTQLNRVSLSEKKIAQGGYMSPPKLPNGKGTQINQVTGSNVHDGTTNRSTVLSKVISINPLQSSGSRIYGDIKNSLKHMHMQKLSDYASAQSYNNTQMNTYVNTMNNSRLQLRSPTNGQRNKLILNRDIGGTNYNDSPRECGYLNNYRNKSSKHTQYNYNARRHNRSPYELNHIVKSAKNQQAHKLYTKNLSEKHRFNTEKDEPKQAILHIQKQSLPHSHGIHRNCPTIQIVKSRIKTQAIGARGNETIKNSLEDIVGSLEQQDQYLFKHLSMNASPSMPTTKPEFKIYATPLQQPARP